MKQLDYVAGCFAALVVVHQSCGEKQQQMMGGVAALQIFVQYQHHANTVWQNCFVKVKVEEVFAVGSQVGKRQAVVCRWEFKGCCANFEHAIYQWWVVQGTQVLASTKMTSVGQKRKQLGQHVLREMD